MLIELIEPLFSCSASAIVTQAEMKRVILFKSITVANTVRGWHAVFSL